MTRVRSNLALEAPAALEPGAMVDGYCVERVLWVGVDRSILVQALAPGGARVALKLLGNTAADAEELRRVVQLARSRASIEHPHLLRLLKAGEHNGRLYLVSELRSTSRLADRLDQGPLEPGEALRVAAGVAAALEVAHGAGLAHGELTPQSVLLADDEPAHALLSDFGIGREPAHAGRLRMEVEGADYRSPEEVKGAPPRPESNAYSLACVLFECLTGSPPYPYERPLLTLHAHLVEPPPRPCALRRDLPAELDEVFSRAMAKDPAERLGCVALVRAAGQALGVAVAIPAAPDPAPAKQHSRRSRRSATPARPKPARAPTRPARATKPAARAPKRPRAVEPAVRAMKPAPRASEPAARAAEPASRAAKPAPRALKPAPRARKPAPRAARPARRRRRGLRIGLAPALVAGALALSAVSGFALGSADPATERRSPAKAQPQDDSAKLAQAEYVRSVSPVIDRLSARRAGARRRLRRARLPGDQANAASALVKAYSDARRAISAAPSGSAEQAGLLAQLRSAESAYRRLALAARNENDRAWRSASRAAVAHERRFERSLVTLTAA